MNGHEKVLTIQWAWDRASSGCGGGCSFDGKAMHKPFK